jgi:hypothetical protein
MECSLTVIAMILTPVAADWKACDIEACCNMMKDYFRVKDKILILWTVFRPIRSSNVRIVLQSGAGIQRVNIRNIRKQRLTERTGGDAMHVVN